MSEEKKKRVTRLIHIIAETIENEDDCTVLDAIDALAVVEANMINRLKDSIKADVAVDVTATIKNLTR